MGFRLQARVFVAAFCLMWLAAIAQEPGGLPAFASEIASASEDAAVRVEQSAVRVEQTATRVEQTYEIRYDGGLVCEKATDPASNCITTMSDPDLGY